MTTAQVQDVVASLEALGTTQWLENLSRFGITAKKAFGVSMADIQRLGRQLGRDHALAAALWKTEWYEARTLAAFVDEPARVTSAQMDRWCRDFDNWGICDTLCFHLFDRTPHAWAKVEQWSTKRAELEKRAAFALLASLAGHDRQASDEQFMHGLALIEPAAGDGRNFVKKGVSWALRRIGTRNARLRAESLAIAQRLATATDSTARWIGKDALRDLNKKKGSPK